MPSVRWQDHAACARPDIDWQLFFPEDRIGGFGPGSGLTVIDQERMRQAKKVCQRCPVREECLNYALELGIEYGIWGGMSTAQRRKEKRRRRATT